MRFSSEHVNLQILVEKVAKQFPSSLCPTRILVSPITARRKKLFEQSIPSFHLL